MKTYNATKLRRLRNQTDSLHRLYVTRREGIERLRAEIGRLEGEQASRKARGGQGRALSHYVNSDGSRDILTIPPDLSPDQLKKLESLRKERTVLETEIRQIADEFQQMQQLLERCEQHIKTHQWQPREAA